MDNLDIYIQDLEGVDLCIICDDYCKFPSICSNQEELDCICDNCPFYKMLQVLLELEIVRIIK